MLFLVQEKLTLFTERIPVQDSYDLCEAFGGTLVVTDTSKDYDELHKVMQKYNTSQSWLRFTDEGLKNEFGGTNCLSNTCSDTEGIWRDKFTNVQVNFDSVPWRIVSEPTGFVVENCSGLTNEAEDYHWAFDIDCKQKITTVCQDIQVYFRMRGLCADSVLDRLYRLITFGTGRRMFYGPSGWKLSWENDEKFWTIMNDRYPGREVFGNSMDLSSS